MRPADVFEDGRIGSIRNNLRLQHKGIMFAVIDCQDKLNSLCFSMGITPDILDITIARNSPVLRTVAGHSFETITDAILMETGAEVLCVGGDSNVDRIVNGNDVQIKTPYAGGTNLDKGVVSYKCHKTHGAKSEAEGEEYYELAEDFPEFLVGLVSLSPFMILVLHNREIPRHTVFTGRLLSPFSISFHAHPALNAFDRIKVQIGKNPTEHISQRDKSLLPRTGQAIAKRFGLKEPISDEIILDTIFAEENFRIWDMSIRGFLRETVFETQVREHGGRVWETSAFTKQRSDKADGVLVKKTDGAKVFFQMKGVSVNNCKFEEGIVGTETQLTRGRVNDHETRSRMYLKSTPPWNTDLQADFECLILALEPPIVDMFRGFKQNRRDDRWEFYAIPTDLLQSHAKYPHRVKPLQRFHIEKIQEFRINDGWFSQWSGTLR